MSRSLAIAVPTLAVVACLAGCGSNSTAEASTSGPRAVAGTSTAAPDRSYALAPTRRCLLGKKLSVGPIGKPNERLQALGDLAQRTSLAVRSGGQIVGLAFGDAHLLAELLAVPNDRYTLEIRRNAVLLYLPSARRQAALVRACLRP